MSQAFALGAHDLVVRPVNLVELYTRVKCCVRRLRRVTVAIWGAATDQVGRSLEQYIYQLRRKLYPDGCGGLEIETVNSLGHRLHGVN